MFGLTTFRCAVLAGLLALAVSQSAVAAQPSIPANVRAALLENARAVATEEGDGHPYEIEAVRTTYPKATRLLSPGAVAPSCESSPACSSAPQYVVAMLGHFSCNTCSSPPDHSNRPGTVIALIIEAKNPMPQRLFAVSNRYPDLCKAGTPVRLDGRRAPQDVRCPTPRLR
jgi:hypothetical protein